MKNKIKFYLGLFFLITSSFLLIQKKDISVNDIKKALRLSGVTFNEKDIQTMAPYVIRNKNSYVNMRKYNLTKDNVPAFNFSVNNMRSKKTKYTFEDIKTKLPSNKKDIGNFCFFAHRSAFAYQGSVPLPNCFSNSILTN